MVKVWSFLAAKLNRNNLFMANFFKLHKYQTFVSLKIRSMSKIDLPIINSVCDKVCFTINRLPKMLFFIFPNFKWLLSKILWKNNPFSSWISRVLMKFYHVKNVFDLHTFDNETTTMEIHFVSLAFLNDKNIITTSLLFIHLKCTIMHYVDLNSSSINKPLLRAVEYDISMIFFWTSYLCLFWRVACQKLYKKTIIL